jgi:hypothetical protein
MACNCVNCECPKCNKDETPYEGNWSCDPECNSGTDMNDCCKEN